MVWTDATLDILKKNKVCDNTGIQLQVMGVRWVWECVVVYIKAALILKGGLDAIYVTIVDHWQKRMQPEYHML